MLKYTLCVSMTIVLLYSWSRAQDKKLTGSDVDFASIYKHEGLELAAENNLTDAVNSLKKSLSYEPCNLEVLFYLSMAEDPGKAGFLRHLIEIGRIKKESSDSLIRALNHEINDDYIRFVFSGLIFDRVKKYGEAWQSYAQAVSLDSGQAYIYFLKARDSMNLSNYRDAIGGITRAMQLKSCSFRLYFQRGLAYYRMANIDLAIRDYQSALALAPFLKRSLHNSQLICEAYNQRGIRRLQDGQYQQALKDFNIAIAIHPGFSEPYLNRGVTFRKMGIYNSAIEDFNRAIELHNNYVDAYFNRGLTFNEMEQYDRALRDLKTAVIMNPAYHHGYYHMGNIYFAQNDFYAAIDAYTRCIEADSNFVWAYYKRGQSYDRLRKFPGAINDYDHFFIHAPDSFLDQKVNSWERSELLKQWLEQRK